MDRIVLGGGPVGLIAAYLLSADLCVSDRVGGDSRLRSLAPTYLWRTEATEQLLSDLEIPALSRSLRFGYLHDGGVKIEAGAAEREEYVRRSRSLRVDAPVSVPTSALSSGADGRIDTFDVSVDDLTRALSARVQVELGRVESIRFDPVQQGRCPPEVTLRMGDRTLRTGCLVNTIPAPEYDVVCEEFYGSVDRPTNHSWDAGAKAFAEVGLSELGPDLRWAARELDLSYVYVVSADRERYPFDRVTFFADRAVLEYNAADELSARRVAGRGPGELRASGRYQVRGPSRAPVEHAGAVYHLGRLARWSHEIRLHDVVEELYG